MSTAEHTPGPWQFSFESTDPEWAIITTTGGVVIANVNSDHRQKANTRLIVNAPDLLTELQNIADAKRFDRAAFPSDAEFIEWAQSRAQAAIAKATGEGKTTP